ncbi:serine hydrolase domain-containing protein [Streptomyces syringium]|uniref:serine hydrolase domain-containing protein n=1 Tax=Streptomyces syringium TaxID=76729 RepID=UPI003454DF4A
MSTPLRRLPAVEEQALLAPLLPAAGAVVITARVAGRQVIAAAGAAGDGRAAAGPETRFEIGSISKTFAGLLLAEMAARGEVAYDAPVERFLPPGTAPRSRGGRVTLLHLATHTSGLPRLPAALLLHAGPRWFSDPYAAFGTDELLASVRRSRPRPGRRVRYSTFGIGLLGLALSRAAGTPYPDLLATRVLHPLGLHRTDCGQDPDQATGYWHGRPRPPISLPGMPAAGAVRSTGRDLLAYTEALLAPEEAGPGLPESLRTGLAEAVRPRLAVRPGGDRVGLVWNIRRRPGHDLYFHTGATRGFTAFAGFSPQARVVFTAAVNQTCGRRADFVQQAYLLLRGLADGAAPQGMSGKVTA